MEIIVGTGKPTGQNKERRFIFQFNLKTTISLDEVIILFLRFFLLLEELLDFFQILFLVSIEELGRLLARRGIFHIDILLFEVALELMIIRACSRLSEAFGQLGFKDGIGDVVVDVLDSDPDQPATLGCTAFHTPVRCGAAVGQRGTTS